MKKKCKDDTSSGCLMGPNWWIYILCIIGVILFVLLIVWLSAQWSTKTVNSPTLTGKSILEQFSNDCVPAV